MFGNLLSLNDRVEPGGANDEDEVIKLASALDEVEGRKPVHREIGSFDQSTVIERTRKFQRARGLQADGLVNPNGPTAQRIAAEQFRRRPALPHRVVLGRGANLPLWASVGEGGVNLPDDTQAMTNALRLTGHWPVAGIPMTRARQDSGTVEAIRGFQRHHGLRPDGLAEPFGPTHDMLDDVLGPRLAKLVGEDPTRPATFEPAEPQIVARNVPFRSTTIRTRFQDEADLDSEDDYRAAVDLGRSISEDVAAAWQSVPLVGDVSTVDLAGMTGDDQFEDDGVSKNAPVFHDNSGSPVERAKSMLETRRFAALKAQPELQERVTSSARGELAGKPDRAVEAKLAALMRQARQVRDPNSPQPKGDPHRGLLYPRLVVAHMEILAERYRDRHPDLTDDEINRMVLAKAALGMGLSNEQAEQLLTFAPYTGPAFAVLDGIDLVMNVADMVETGEFEWGTIAMAAAAFVPGVPRGVGQTGKDAAKKGDGPDTGKSGEDEGRSDDQRRSDDDDRDQRDEDTERAHQEQQKARGDLLDWQEAAKKTGEAKRAQELFDPKVWKTIDPKMQATIESLFSHAKKRGSEAHLYRTMEIAGVLVPVERRRVRRTRVVDLEGNLRTRHWDAFSSGWLERSADGLEISIVDTGQIRGVELKVGKSKPSTNQRKADAATREDRETVIEAPENAPDSYPSGTLSGEIVDLRMPILDIPEHLLVEEVRSLMNNKGVPDELIDHLVGNIRDSYHLAGSLHQSGSKQLALGITIAAALGIALPDDGTES